VTLTRFKTGVSLYEHLGAVVASTAVLLAAGTWLALWLRNRNLPAWVTVAVATPLVIAVLVAYGLGRMRKKLNPSTAERAVAELEVANAYIKHVSDFMDGLRLSAIGLPSEDALPRLRQLRELVFDAIIQGINSGPGEHIRCALFEPRDEAGDKRLRVRTHRGHTHRVEHLSLGMGSVAGIAFTTREPLYVPDEHDPRVEQTNAGRPVRTLFCLPLYTFRANADAPVGVFSVASNRHDAFSESDRAFISACAGMIGVLEFFIGIWENMPKAPRAPGPGPRAVDPGPGAQPIAPPAAPPGG
jgi:hypothetical protein